MKSTSVVRIKMGVKTRPQTISHLIHRVSYVLQLPRTNLLLMSQQLQ